MGMAKPEKGMLRGWRAFLAMALVASLALGMTPFAATEAHAATKTKSYVYDVVYGTYQGKYAIGFNLAKKATEGVVCYDSIDVISATKGATIKVRAGNFPGNEWEIRQWAADLQGWGNRGFNPAVIAVPFKNKGAVSYRAHTLDGKRVSSTIYDGMGSYTDGNAKNSFTILWSGKGKKRFVADCYNSSGKKVQSITLSSTKAIEWVSVWAGETNGDPYLEIDVNDTGSFYRLKKGKFVKTANPWNSGTSDSNYVGDGVYLKHVYTGMEATYYLEDSKGNKTTLPQHPDQEPYTAVQGIGVYVGDWGSEKTYVYNKIGKLLGVLPGTGAIEKTVIPGVWSMGDLAFDSSLKLLGTEKNVGYGLIKAGGKFGGRSIFAAPVGNRSSWYDFDRYVYVREDMSRAKVGGYLLESTLTASTPIHTFKNGRQVAVAKNSSGKFGVVDAKGNVLIPFSYSDFYDTGSGDYIMMKKGKGWQFVKVSHLASGKAVQGGIYTIGKLKYKVTSTAKKTPAVTVVGHAKGKAATGSASVPATVKIAGQKFKVTAVGASAFKNTKLTSVTIGKYVTSIGKNAFAGSKNLAKVTVKSKALKSVGKGAFKGINKKAKFKVPASKVKAYKKILNSKAGVKKSMKVSK